MQRGDVVLDCTHKVKLVTPLPEPGALQWCYGCDEYRAVMAVPKPWLVRCKARKGCFEALAYRYEDAEKRMKQHEKARPNHVIHVMKSFSIVGIYAGVAEGYRLIKPEVAREEI